jgi:hypothetical protein
MNLSAGYVNGWMPSVPLPAPSFHVLMLPDFERADRIGEFWSYPESRASPSCCSTARRIESSGRARRDVAGGRGAVTGQGRGRSS